MHPQPRVVEYLPVLRLLSTRQVISVRWSGEPHGAEPTFPPVHSYVISYFVLSSACATGPGSGVAVLGCFPTLNEIIPIEESSGCLPAGAVHARRFRGHGYDTEIPFPPRWSGKKH
jgi:hypothetical protein